METIEIVLVIFLIVIISLKKISQALLYLTHNAAPEIRDIADSEVASNEASTNTDS